VFANENFEKGEFLLEYKGLFDKFYYSFQLFSLINSSIGDHSICNKKYLIIHKDLFRIN